jgi:hypothetical protein
MANRQLLNVFFPDPLDITRPAQNTPADYFSFQFDAPDEVLSDPLSITAPSLRASK